VSYLHTALARIPGSCRNPDTTSDRVGVTRHSIGTCSWADRSASDASDRLRPALFSSPSHCEASFPGKKSGPGPRSPGSRRRAARITRSPRRKPHVSSFLGTLPRRRQLPRHASIFLPLGEQHRPRVLSGYPPRNRGRITPRRIEIGITLENLQRLTWRWFQRTNSINAGILVMGLL
jgi:hypothetical protein